MTAINKHTSLVFLVILLIAASAWAQGNPPWNNPLKIAWSSDGTAFTNTTIFQDSAGVPCVLRWKGDTLVCVFQWFRAPMGSLTWDRVAVKFSYDAGVTWTEPTPIIVDHLPASFQRPFDPTLVAISADSLRLFYSSSDGMPTGGLNGLVNTYSAVSTDGIHFQFELGPRYDDSTRPAIDPSVIFYRGQWQYASTDGISMDGAYHATSIDGVHFLTQPKYTTDNTHAWTGNFMVNDSNELRFYGSGQHVWYSPSFDGMTWNGFVTTNILGGDPSVVRISPSKYLVVYVGQPYSTDVEELHAATSGVHVYPTIVENSVTVLNAAPGTWFEMFDVLGKSVWSGSQTSNLNCTALTTGVYFLKIVQGKTFTTTALIKR